MFLYLGIYNWLRLLDLYSEYVIKNLSLPLFAQLFPVLTQELSSFILVEPAAPLGCEAPVPKPGVDQ